MPGTEAPDRKTLGVQRLLKDGLISFSDRDLITHLLLYANREDVALSLSDRLFSEFGDSVTLLNAVGDSVSGFPGMNDATLLLLRLIPELCRRAQKSLIPSGFTVSCPADAARVCRPWYLSNARETVCAILLSSDNRVLDVVRLSKGGANRVFLNTEQLLLAAIDEDWKRVILTHSHPGGDPTPSPEDISLTRDLYDRMRFFDVCLVDHLVISQTDFVSLYELLSPDPPCAGYGTAL